MIFSSILSVFVMPVILIVDPTVFDVDRHNIAILCIVGLLNSILIWCYLMALKEDETSIVVVFYQLVPVFGYVLGYFILGETLTEKQFLAMAIIILGTSIISFEVDKQNKLKLRQNTIIYMFSASFCWALGSVIFKAVALEENVWRSLFWEHLMLVFIGILIFIFIPKYRRHLILSIQNNSRVILSLNAINEAIYILGNAVVAFAYLLAPVALVLLAESFQPIFVLLIGIFLAMFFPNLSAEQIDTRHLWQKILAIFLTGIGTYLLLTPKGHTRAISLVYPF